MASSSRSWLEAASMGRFSAGETVFVPSIGLCTVVQDYGDDSEVTIEYTDPDGDSFIIRCENRSDVHSTALVHVADTPEPAESPPVHVGIVPTPEDAEATPVDVAVPEDAEATPEDAEATPVPQDPEVPAVPAEAPPVHDFIVPAVPPVLAVQVPDHEQGVYNLIVELQRRSLGEGERAR